MQSDGSPHFLRVPQERPMYHSTSSRRTSPSPFEELSGSRRGPSEIGAPIYNGVGVVKRHEWFASQERSQGRFGGVCRTVHRRPLTPRMARQNSHATKPTGLRLEQDLFVRSRPRLAS